MNKESITSVVVCIPAGFCFLVLANEPDVYQARASLFVIGLTLLFLFYYWLAVWLFRRG